MKQFLSTVVFCAMAACAIAQPKFSYDDIANGKFRQKRVMNMASTKSGEEYTVLKSDAILKYSYRTGVLTDTVCAFSALGDNVSVDDYQFSPDEKKLLLKTEAKSLYRHSDYSRYLIYDCKTTAVVPLSASDSIRYAVFSPDGTMVAYALDNNIFVKFLADGTTRQVTFDGKFNHIINGMPDWVYEEEFALDNAMRWSPDSKQIAYVRTDESSVKEFSFARYQPGSESGYASIYTYKYPVAGEENSVVELYTYSITDNRTTKIDTGAEKDMYIPYFEWTPDSRLYFFTLNRLQNHLAVTLCDNGGQRTIYEENSEQYIDEIDPKTITFIGASGKFIARNETISGFYHLYLYDIDKGLVAPITSGDWDVSELVYADEKKAAYLSNEESRFGNNLYTIGINGKNKKRLTEEKGSYTIEPGEGFKYYIASFSNVSTPLRITLHDSQGKQARVLEDNSELKAYIDEINLPRKEFISFITPEGYELYGYIIKPENFDASKRYPVLFSQYSGPSSREVVDSWSIGWEDVLVQNGYIVACFDPRGTGGRGEAFKKLTYGKMGLLETQDQISAARYMASLPYVDGSRIGIYGWSYGGFMALNCILKGADVFKMAISVAPVTSWRYYDSIYTERFNGLPQDNPQGYDEPSPIGYADNLKGKLLLIHGTADDNVHVLSSHLMAKKLVAAQKEFDMMIYTDTNHSMVPGGSTHIRKHMIEYCLKNL